MANRNAELNRLNSDLVNLQTSTRLAILLLGRDLRSAASRRRPKSSSTCCHATSAGPSATSGTTRLRGRPRSPLDLETLVAEVIDTRTSASARCRTGTAAGTRCASAPT